MPLHRVPQHRQGRPAVLPAKGVPSDTCRVRLRPGRLRRAGHLVARRVRRRRQVAGGRPLAHAAHEVPPGVAGGARRHRSACPIFSYIREDGDKSAHRCAHPAPRHRDQASCSSARAAARQGGRSHVGDPQVRHRGTIGGSLVHGDPASDLPAAILALGPRSSSRAPTAPAKSPPTTSSPASSKPRSGPTSSSPRSRCPR